jgi:hypothetical protein
MVKIAYFAFPNQFRELKLSFCCVYKILWGFLLLVSDTKVTFFVKVEIVRTAIT